MRVFYRSEQTAPVQGYSPSAAKPAQVMTSWADLGLPVTVLSFEPVTPADLQRVHDPAYVTGVLSGEVPNGFGTRDRQLAASLRYTSGSMVAAVLDVLATGSVAVSPTSGFHHAGYEGGGGFCTFNGLALAALKALDAGAERVAILDLDAHWGNGTDAVIRHLELRSQVRNHSAGYHDWAPADDPATAPYFGWLDRALAEIRGWPADVLIAQMGADCSLFDPLGGHLDDADLVLRDRTVFGFCQAHAIPLAWNLAGGYATDEHGTIQPVLDIHARTAAECVRVYEGTEVQVPGRLRRRNARR